MESFWAAVAAVAALVALVFAYLTVRQGVRNRKESNKAHADQMEQRRQAVAAELRLARIMQVERVAEVLADLAEVAQRETITPPGRPHTGDETRARLYLLPAMIARLGAAQAALDVLGGPDLESLRSLRQSASPRDFANLVDAVSNCLDEIRRVLGELENV